MVNYDLIFIILFYGLLLIYFLRHREKFEVQAKVFALYRTKIGLKFMDKIAKLAPRFLKFLGFIGIILSFLGMIFIVYILIKGTYSLLITPEAPPVLAPVLPGVSIPGLPRLSFWHWIISIFIVAVVHEFSHGIFSRLYKLKIKSSGFAFLGPILAAFVEPDEKKMRKKSKKAQLSIIAAGPFSNMIFFLIFFLFAILIINPVSSSMFELEGVKINSLEEGYPAENVGMNVGEEILEVNNITVNNINNFIVIMNETKVNDIIFIKTNRDVYQLKAAEHPKEDGKGYIGVIIEGNKLEIKEEAINKYGNKFPWALVWFAQLIFWIYLINLGIGLFNLLPFAPLDGGRMFYLALFAFTKDEKLINKIWKLVSLFILFLIIINLLPYLIQLINFIFSPLINLI